MKRAAWQRHHNNQDANEHNDVSKHIATDTIIVVIRDGRVSIMERTA